MSDPNTDLATRLAAVEAENAALKATAEAATAALNEQKRAATHAEHAAFAESLVKAGKLTPGVAPAMVATLDYLADSPADFAEGDQQMPLAQAFRAALAALPAVIPLGEHAAEHGESRGAAVPYAAPSGYDVDPAALDLHRRAQAYAETHKTDYLTAVAAIQKGV